jgi:hypothetical protein
MSGSTIGAVVGAAIGFIVGGPSGAYYGWMIGSVAGGILMPEEMQGPRLDDLRPQGSEYGRPIPIIYGTVGVTGNVIWQSDLVEVEEGGGKGGPSVTNYSYYANFAIALCEGEVEGLGRIWAGPEKRLIYDGTVLEGGGSLTFYNGSETQMPDPLMESYLGAGNVPAYRGIAYVVFENFPVANDGNMIPFLTVEVGNVTTSPPYDWIAFPVGDVFVDVPNDQYIYTFSGAVEGVIRRQLSDNDFIDYHEAPAAGASVVTFYDPDRERIIFVGIVSTQVYDIASGAAVATWVTGATWPQVGGGTGNLGAFPKGGVYHDGMYVFLCQDFAGDTTRISCIDPDTFEELARYQGVEALGPLVNFNDNHRQDGDSYILGVTTAGQVRKFPLSAGYTTDSCGSCVVGAANKSCRVDPYTGYVWTFSWAMPDLTYSVNDPVTESQVYSGAATIGSTEDTSIRPVTFKPGEVVYTQQGPAPLFSDVSIIFDPLTPATYTAIVGVAHGTGTLEAGWWNPTRNELWFTRDYMWANRFTDGGSYNSIALWDTNNDDSPGSGFKLGERGAITIGGETLANVVADLCERAGLSPSDYDVTDLDDTVDGYVIAQQTSVRGGIQSLQPTYFFDAVESSGVAKFVTRGGAVAATIPDSDLSAHTSGSESDIDLLEIKRQMEDELPHTLVVGYIQFATNYTNVNRYARRLVGASGDEQRLDMPIVMSDTRAQGAVETNLHLAWVRRKMYRFNLPRKYAYLEPTDVVSIRGQQMFLVRVTDADGVLKCEGFYDDFNYQPNVVVTETPNSDQEVYVPSETVLELL